MSNCLRVGVVVLMGLTVVGCAGAEPAPTATNGPASSTPSATPTELPTATHTAAPTETVEPTDTDTPIPPTPTRIPPTATPGVPTATPGAPMATLGAPMATPGAPMATPRPATHTVCANGCDFTTIQAALDDPSTDAATGSGQWDGAIIEVRDPVHTEPGIVVRKDVTIRGLGAGSTIVQAQETVEEALERVFLIEEGATVILERMTIRHGRPSAEEECGGGIMNLGSLTLRQCVVAANRCNSGAGICTRGELTLVNSSVSENLADGAGPVGYACGSGAGIKCERGALTMMSSTISGNTSEDTDIFTDRARGGGVHVGCNCTAVFTNSTVSGNTSVAYAGGVYIRGSLRLVNCTIKDNRTSGEGGGLYVRGHLDFVNTIIANNRGTGGNCVIGGPGGYQGKGQIGVNSNNLIVGGTCDPAYADDPLLGPLADNGGDTLTHALLPGSPAIDAVPVVSCTVPTDQRGELRPMVQTSPETPCDIGAFEVQPGQ